MFIFLAAITGFLLYYYLPQNYVVSLKGIQIGTWRGYVFIPWQDVTQIITLPSRNIQLDLALILKEKDTTKQIGLGLPILAFHKYSALAIIEAATVSNPCIELKFEHANDFGKPPYGIFNR